MSIFKRFVQGWKNTLALKAVMDSDEYGIMLAGYIIMWTGVVFVAITGLKQIIAIAFFFGKASDLLTIDNLVGMLLAVTIVVMGMALTFQPRWKLLQQKLNESRQKKDAPQN